MITNALDRNTRDEAGRWLADQLVRALVKGHSEPIELPHVCELFVWQRLSSAR